MKRLDIYRSDIMQKRSERLVNLCRILGVFLLLLGAPGAKAERVITSLDGVWQIEESVSPNDAPLMFQHKVPVPGLANLAKPSFEDVDLFDSKELISNRIRSKKADESTRVQGAGTSRQNRNYFWYRREFNAPDKKTVAILKINKAQFGTAVWVNGEKMGEYAGCFSAGIFDVSKAVKWKGNNVLLIRIGAHPGVLPDTYPTGTDFEKLKWTPGIYDSVSVSFSENPVIQHVQVAPKLDATNIVVQTTLRNTGPAGDYEIGQQVRTWKGNHPVSKLEPMTVTLAEGEEKVVTQTVDVPSARLWSPEDPFLYVVETTTAGDSLATRFGMREFRSDAATKRFYLNGKVYYLRGSNITFHRFLEDPVCGDLPWNEAWVRKLLGEIPKKMNWNSFRFCIGPVPDRWLEICDEVGLLIQNEFFIWTGAPSWDKKYSRSYDTPEMIRQYKDWMRDNWNHPSVAIWDANNESEEPLFGKEIIPAVRGLDLSNRPWENSYNPPVAPDDPVEDHPYLFQSAGMTDEPGFRLPELLKMDGTGGKNGTVAAHPRILNEYGWVWLNRDGTPTLLTEKLYPKLLGPNSTTEQRYAANAYLLAALTEFWRTHRQYAGVLHFVYLTCSYPGVYTADHFLDVPKLKLVPQFADYVSEAFKPLGVYLEFFDSTLPAGTPREFSVRLINDEARAIRGHVAVSLETVDGKPLSSAARPFAMSELGSTTVKVRIPVPQRSVDCILKATAREEGKEGATVSRRWVSLGVVR